MTGRVRARTFGELPENVDMGQLAGFIDVWRAMSQTPPTSPDEVDRMTWQVHVVEGNTQAATAILSDWFAASASGGSSLIDRALEGDNADVNGETIKALDALKFLDDPRSMVREVGSGMLEADAGRTAGGRAGGAGAGSALAALFEGSATVASAVSPGKAESVDEADPLEGGGRAEAYTPRWPSEAVAVDLDTLGSNLTEELAEEAADDGEAAPGDDASPEPPDAMAEIEAEIDRDAGEHPRCNRLDGEAL